MMPQNGQNSHHLRENEPAIHIGEQSEISRMNAHCASHLKRNTEIVAGEDLLNCHTLDAILEKVPAVSNDCFCSSQTSMMCQAQDHQSDGRFINNAYQIDSIGYKPLDSLEGRLDSISPTTSKNGLIRHSSSPAGLPFPLAVGVQSLSENGYTVGPIRDIVGITNVGIEDASCRAIAPNRLGSQTAFLRHSSSPAGLTSQHSPDMDLPEIAEKPNMPMMKFTTEIRDRNKSGDDNLANGIEDQGYSSNLFAGSWEDASMFPGKFPGMQTGISFAARKHGREFNEEMMPDLSLPESQVRRTRISERMRKLQQLVPNMDQQTSTADMLDEAAKYIKLLQKQVQELSMNRSECKGSCKCNSDCTANI